MLALKDEKKILQIALKIKSPECYRQTEWMTDRMTDRLTLNFINIDIIILLQKLVCNCLPCKKI